jgi:hypothetical protein
MPQCEIHIVESWTDVGIEPHQGPESSQWQVGLDVLTGDVLGTALTA